jgi:hypothetical protein
VLELHDHVNLAGDIRRLQVGGDFWGWTSMDQSCSQGQSAEHHEYTTPNYATPKSAFMLLLTHDCFSHLRRVERPEIYGLVLFHESIFDSGNLIRQSHAWVTIVTFGEAFASYSNLSGVTKVAFWRVYMYICLLLRQNLRQKCPQI